jgi:glycosyltransferase involved in cell wall biosynthesis
MAQKLIVISANSSWNIYNYRAGLIRGLGEAGYKVLAVAPPDRYSSRLDQLGCRYIPLPMDANGQSPARDSLLFLRYLRLLRRLRPDVFLGYTIKPNIFGSLAAHLLGIPVINNVSGLGSVFVGETWTTKLARFLYSRAFSLSKTVFFQNADDRDLFINMRLVRPQRSALVPGSGVDLAKFHPRTASKQGAQSSVPVFLLIGRLIWDKGVSEFAEAARLVKQQLPEARFQILGFLEAASRDAIPRSQMDAWVNEGLIEYLGNTDDVRPAIAEASCVVLPSAYREGTPRVLLEAGAMGKPLIATDMPGCRDAVSDGINGFLCAPRNHKDLARKLIAFLSLEPAAREQMGSASRMKVEREYDERIVVSRYLAAIENATGSLDPHAHGKVAGVLEPG